MATIVVVCPFCQKRLETSDSNAGRDGQCPACEKVFEIAPLQRPKAAAGVQAAGAAGQESEYQDTSALVSLILVGVGLVLMVMASLSPWADPYGKLAGFAPAQKMVILAVSAACCAFLVVSLMGGKSLMPAAIVSSAWGTVALVWSWGIWHNVNQAIIRAGAVEVQASLRSQVGIKGGLVFTLVAAVFVVGASLYAYFQCKGRSTFPRLGTFMFAAECVALVVGLLIVRLYVQPGVQDRIKAVPVQESPAPTPAPKEAPPAAEEPAPKEPPAETRPGYGPLKLPKLEPSGSTGEAGR
jgi:hypothetical protein